MSPPPGGSSPAPARLSVFVAGALVGALLTSVLAPRAPAPLGASPLRSADGGGGGARVPTLSVAAGASASSSSSSSSFTPPPWWDVDDAPKLRAPACAAATMQRAAGAEGWPSFLEVVSASGSDKGTNAAFPPDKAHEYAPLYAKYLGPLRDRAMRVLEIGLGCGMPVEGASIPLWRRYLPCASLFMMELHGDCLQKWAPQLDGIAIGDQSLPADLAKAFALGPFQVIIDDGGHSMLQQTVTIREAMRVLPEGGLLVVEDLLTSFLPNFFDIGDRLEGRTQTAHRFIADVIQFMHRKAETQYYVTEPAMAGAREVAALTESVDCFREACVFVRNKRPV